MFGVVVAARRAATGAARFDAVEMFVDVAANFVAHTCRQPLAVAHTIS